MSDLISRKALIETIVNTPTRVLDNAGNILDVLVARQNEILDMIDSMLTAYDVDKVLEQLQDASHWTDCTFDEDGFSNDDSEEVIYLYKANAIVAEGGIHDK